MLFKDRSENDKKGWLGGAFLKQSDLLTFYRFGNSRSVVVILHGLFGSADNWRTVAKAFSEAYQIVLVDLCNHGNSPHCDDMTYVSMANDVVRLLDYLRLPQVILLGHSMGGKVAMTLASFWPDRVSKLVVVDIAPKAYPPHHQDILDGIRKVQDEAPFGDRRQVDLLLSQFISEERVRQFILRSYIGDSALGRIWQFNADVIAREYPSILLAPGISECQVETYFIRGSLSDYILDTDGDHIRRLFPYSVVRTVQNAGHWIHAEQFSAFLQECRRIL